MVLFTNMYVIQRALIIFELNAIDFCRNELFKRRNRLKDLSRIPVTGIYFLLILAALIGCAMSQPIEVDPELPGSAQNNGTDSVIVSWDYPYKFTVTNYDLIIAKEGDKGSIVQSYNVADASPGQKSPLKAFYKWNVPKDAVQGRYKAELQISTVEAGGAVHDTISRAFEVARDQGTLRIFKYLDSSGDGKHDTGENGLAKWSFTITTPSNERYTRNTDSNGFIELKDLPVGTYVVMESENPGYKPTTDVQQSIHVIKDKSVDALFGNQPLPARLKIVKYEDKNKNLTQDSNELGVSGWEFYIKGPSSFNATTDSTGL